MEGAMDNEYPRMLYHPDGRTQVVYSAEEESSAEGFGRDPQDVHRTTDEGTVRRVETSGYDDRALVIADTVIARLLERFDIKPHEDDGDEVSTQDIARPRRGRPPRNQAETDEAPAPRTQAPAAPIREA